MLVDNNEPLAVYFDFVGVLLQVDGFVAGTGLQGNVLHGFGVVFEELVEILVGGDGVAGAYPHDHAALHLVFFFDAGGQVEAAVGLVAGGEGLEQDAVAYDDDFLQ